MLSARSELYRRKTLFLDDFPIFFFYPNETWTHPPTSNFFLDFWNFFNFAKPLRRSQHLRIRQMAGIFLIIESRIIGRRFAGGLCFIPGFGRGVSIPDLIFAGYLPVLAMVFSSVEIPLCISGGTYFTYSAFSPSSPTLFCFFMLFRCLFDFFGCERSFHFGRFLDCGFICCYRCKDVLKAKLCVISNDIHQLHYIPKHYFII